MNTSLIVLLLVGIILMTANAAKAKTVPKKAHQETKDGKKIVYKYLPLDLDAFYRQEAVGKPSKLYYSMFEDENIVR